MGAKSAGKIGKVFSVSTSFSEDEIDQEQNESNNGYRIYKDYWAAQSFKTCMERITRVKILINRTEKKSFSVGLSKSSLVIKNSFGLGLNKIKESLLEKKSSFLNKLSNRGRMPLGKVGSITLSIRKDIDGRDLTKKTLSPEEIRKDADWIEFDFPDVDVEQGGTYYIVVRASGGDEKNFYKWLYMCVGPYENGNAFISDDHGATWRIRSSWDFAFKVYGRLPSEEPDGVVDRWAVIVGIENYGPGHKRGWYADDDAYDMRNVLISHGWQDSHIKFLTNEEGTKENIKSAIQWMDSNEDSDDICLFFFCGHGDPGIVYTYGWCALSGWELDAEFDKLGSKNVAVILNSCYSGSMESRLAQSGRVILMSSKSNEISW
ncbi:MAG: hypothetical protein FE038_01835 [Thermoplasmata archaeon]|nr:MAG: hypothetical protein FE038_01835 [Thermoplasmata archaeon]